MESAEIDKNQDEKHASDNVPSNDNRLYDTVIIGAGAAVLGWESHWFMQA